MTVSDEVGFRSLTSGEIGVLLVSLALYTVLVLAGRAVTKRTSPLAIQPLVGLCAVYFLFVLGSLAWSGFTIWLPFGFLVALAGWGGWRCRKGLPGELGRVAFSVAVLLPLCLLAAVFEYPLWDDFSQWLPSARYLFSQEHLPTAEHPVWNHATPSYPYSRALLHAWVNSFTGDFTVNVQGIFNILFASSLLLWALPFVDTADGKNSGKYTKPLAMCFMSGLVIVWAATLNTRLIVTSYADPVFSVAITHLFVYTIYRHVSESDDFDAGDLNLSYAFLLAVPPIIKDAGIYYSVFLFACFWSFSWLPRAVKAKPALGALVSKNAFHLLHLLPALVIQAGWGLYVATNDLARPFAIREPSAWNFQILPQIVSSALHELLDRPHLIAGLLLIALLLIVSAYRGARSSEAGKYALCAALGFTALTSVFHLSAYLAAFSEYEALRAASFNRYMAPAGLVVWTSVFVVALIWLHENRRAIFRVSSILMALALTASVVANAHRIVPPPRFSAGLEQEALQIKERFNKGETLLIFDLLTSGLDAVVIKYHLNDYMPAAYVSNVDYTGVVTEEQIVKWVGDYRNVHIRSATQRQRELIRKAVEADR